jgi:hypothetical protein
MADGKKIVGWNWLMIACEKAAIDCCNLSINYYLVIIVCCWNNIDYDKDKIDC